MRNLSKLEKTIMLIVFAFFACGAAYATYSDITKAANESKAGTESIEQAAKELDQAIKEADELN